MASAKKNKQKTAAQDKKGAVAKSATQSSLQWLLLALIAGLTFACYTPSLSGEFINMDDDDYVSNNEMIHSFSNLKRMITEPVQGNYHPLTMMSLALNYSIGGNSTTGYHLLTLLLHMANAVLVFFFVQRLSGNRIVIAFCAALLFGVHPMHVESVSWIAERKDVLYTFFFLLGLISYLRYVDSTDKKWLLWTSVCAILSLASKPAAIVFPLAVLSLDLQRGRSFNAQVFIEKIPLFLFSALMAWITLGAQTAGGATDTSNAFPLQFRFFFGFYSMAMYIYKFVAPINLAAFYQLPAFNEALPSVYYIGLPVVLVCATLVYVFRKRSPLLVWGSVFFVVNLLLILQFKVIGSAIIAERYSYVPYIGLAVVLGWLIDSALAKKQNVALGVVALLGLLCAGRCYAQAATWKDSASVWESAIQNVPSERAYTNRASTLRTEGKIEKALEYYNKGLDMYKLDHWGYCNRGNIYFDLNKDSLAIADYTRALDIQPRFAPALANRGAVRVRAGHPAEALPDLNAALEINPNFKLAYTYRAIALFNLQRHEEAARDYQKYISFVPQDVENRHSLATCYKILNRPDKALATLSECIAIQPKPQFYAERAELYAAQSNMAAARADALKAQQGGLKVNPALLGAH